MQLEDDCPGSNVRDKIVNHLPDSWKECSWDYEELETKAALDDNMAVNKQGQVDFNGLWFFGAKDSSVYCGIECSGVGNVRLLVAWPHVVWPLLLAGLL